MRKNLFFCVVSVLIAALNPFNAIGQDTRLLRSPDVSDKAIVFSYAGDLWSVGRDGGEARRLTSTVAIESSAHFSRDGQTIAFSSNCTGNNRQLTFQGTDRQLHFQVIAPAIMKCTSSVQMAVSQDVLHGILETISSQDGHQMANHFLFRQTGAVHPSGCSNYSPSRWMVECL
jgi:hypothetical protein